MSKQPRKDIISPTMLKTAADARILLTDAEQRDRDLLRLRKAAIAELHARNAEQSNAARQLYREERARKGPQLARQQAKTLKQVRDIVDAANARAADLRKGGRPSSKRLNPMQLSSRSPDVLVNTLPEYHGVDP